MQQMKRCCEGLFVFFETIIKGKSKKKRKRTWVCEIFQKRIEKGVYHNLLQEIRVSDRESYFT